MDREVAQDSFWKDLAIKYIKNKVLATIGMFVPNFRNKNGADVMKRLKMVTIDMNGMNSFKQAMKLSYLAWCTVEKERLYLKVHSFK